MDNSKTITHVSNFSSTTDLQEAAHCDEASQSQEPVGVPRCPHPSNSTSVKKCADLCGRILKRAFWRQEHQENSLPPYHSLGIPNKPVAVPIGHEACIFIQRNIATELDRDAAGGSTCAPCSRVASAKTSSKSSSTTCRCRYSPSHSNALLPVRHCYWTTSQHPITNT